MIHAPRKSNGNASKVIAKPDPSSTAKEICIRRVTTTAANTAHTSHPIAAYVEKCRPSNSSAEPSTERATNGNAITTPADTNADAFLDRVILERFGFGLLLDLDTRSLRSRPVPRHERPQ